MIRSIHLKYYQKIDLKELILNQLLYCTEEMDRANQQH